MALWPAFCTNRYNFRVPAVAFCATVMMVAQIVYIQTLVTYFQGLSLRCVDETLNGGRICGAGSLN